MPRYYKIDNVRATQIVENAMNAGWLLWISTRAWGNRRKLAEEILREKFQDHADAITASQTLIDSDEVKKVTAPMQKAQSEAHKRSQKWFHKGVYFVFERDIEYLDNMLKDAQTEVRQNREILARSFPNLKAKAKKKYPDIYREEYYINPEELVYRFDLIWGWQRISAPMSNNKEGTGSFKSISKDVVDRENKKFVELMKKNTEEVIAATRKSFLEIVKHLRDKLVDPDATFKQTSVEKPKEFLKQFKDINIFGDVPFAEVAKDIEYILDGMDAQDLRDDDIYRKDMGEVLQEVVEVFEDLPIVQLERALEF